jgi:hypothetical protein
VLSDPSDVRDEAKALRVQAGRAGGHRCCGAVGPRERQTMPKGGTRQMAKKAAKGGKKKGGKKR